VDSNHKQEHELTFSQNCAFDGGYHAAVKVCADAGKTKAVKDVNTIFAATGQSWGDAWVRGCVTKNFWGLGYSTTQGGDTHSFEAQYDASKNAKPGILNHPMYLRTGSCFNLENKCKLSVYSCIGQ
jgi:hypothetical protein